MLYLLLVCCAVSSPSVVVSDPIIGDTCAVEPLAVRLDSVPSPIDDVLYVNFGGRFEYVATASGGTSMEGRYLYLWYCNDKPLGQIDFGREGRLIMPATYENQGGYHCTVVDFSDPTWISAVADYLKACLN